MQMIRADQIRDHPDLVDDIGVYRRRSLQDALEPPRSFYPPSKIIPPLIHSDELLFEFLGYASQDGNFSMASVLLIHFPEPAWTHAGSECPDPARIRAVVGSLPPQGVPQMNT